MKVKDINKTIVKSLKGFTCHGSIIYKTPLKDILVGYCLETSSIKNNCYLWRFIMPLYIPTDHIYFTFGNRIKNKEGHSMFDFSAPETITEIIALIQNEEKGFLKLDEQQNFYTKYDTEGDKDNIYVQQALSYTMCFIHLDKARLMLQAVIECNKDSDVAWVKPILEQAQQLINTIDSGNQIAMLEGFKKYTIEKLGLI